jgi:hypothetical protein
VEVPGEASKTAIYLTNNVYSEVGETKVLVVKHAKLERPSERRFHQVGLNIAFLKNGSFSGTIDFLNDQSLKNGVHTVNFVSSKLSGDLSPEGEKAVKITLEVLGNYINS